MTARSARIAERANEDKVRRRAQLLPAETSTLAKSPVYANGIAQRLYAVSARGAHFTDVDGHRWLDCDMALGSVVWGHSHPRLVEVARRQAARGMSFSVPSVIEGELAERLVERLRKFDQIQFAKNGSDVTTAAVRLARAVTGRRHVMLGRYHGWHDWSAVHHYGNRQVLGVLEDAQRNSIWIERESAKHVLSILDGGTDPAAIVLCPEHWSTDDLREVRQLSSRRGIVLVFDEVKSGMRFGPRGVFDSKGVVPDLLCLGKGLANGSPLSAILGPRDLMRRLPDVRFSGTFATETLSMAVAVAAEDMLRDQADWPTWEDEATRVMAALTQTIETLDLRDELTVHGYPGAFWVGDLNGGLPQPFRSHFIETLARGKAFTRGYIVPSVAHGPKELARVLELAQAALTRWAAGDRLSSSERSSPDPRDSGVA
jgi:glutamate-1-semialdehyde 2,1-aminomutase